MIMNNNLRIIGGIYKNRIIKMNNISDIRPTSVRARRIIFDTLLHKLTDHFTFLDVFAGAGTLGIEALSRNASMVTFFDIESNIVRNIEQNLKTMDKIQGVYNIIKTSALKPPYGSPVDCVFIDPPYTNIEIIPDVLKRLQKYNWLNNGTILVIEYSKKYKLQLSENFSLWKSSKISSSIIDFYNIIN